MTIGENIKAYLVEKGIKQTFVARQSGIPDSTISEILNKGRRIDILEYWKICTALSVPLEYFLPSESQGAV